MGFPCVLDTTGCEGWPPLSGHLLHVSGMLTSVSSFCPTIRCCWGVLRGCVPPGRRGRTCRQARLRVLWGASHASHRGAVGVTEVGVHRGWACRPGLRLSADGGLPSIAQRQCPDPVACAVRHHPRGHRFGRGLRVCGRPLCPAPRGPVTWERRVRWDGGPGCGAQPFHYCRRVAEVREVRPSSGGCGKRSLGSYLCPTPWAAKASLHSLGVRCACWAGGRHPRWCVRPTGGAVACCAAARCWVVRGVVLGEVCPVGVVVVRGRPRCRWRDGHRPALWWEEAVPGPPDRFFPARCWCGTRAARVRPCVVAAGPVVGRGSGPWGVTRTSYRGAAEGTEDLVHQGRVRRAGLRSSADGGLQLPTQRQCPDLVDREDGA